MKYKLQKHSWWLLSAILMASQYDIYERMHGKPRIEIAISLISSVFVWWLTITVAYDLGKADGESEKK